MEKLIINILKTEDKAISLERINTQLNEITNSFNDIEEVNKVLEKLCNESKISVVSIKNSTLYFYVETSQTPKQINKILPTNPKAKKMNITIGIMISLIVVCIIAYAFMIGLTGSLSDGEMGLGFLVIFGSNIALLSIYICSVDPETRSTQFCFESAFVFLMGVLSFFYIFPLQYSGFGSFTFYLNSILAILAGVVPWVLPIMKLIVKKNSLE